MELTYVVSEPEDPAFLEELGQEHWTVLNELYHRTRPYEPEEKARADLERLGLLEGTRLTELGETAHSRMHRYLGPWNYSKDGKVWMSCAVVATDGNGNGVLLHAFGPAIDWHIDQVGTDLVDLGLDWCPSPGVWVWEGSMGAVRMQSAEYGEDWDFEVTGEWREPTLEEWDHIKENECPWDKDNLPRWKGNDG